MTDFHYQIATGHDGGGDDYTELYWTTEPPTEPGVYWVRAYVEDERRHDVYIANVSIIRGYLSIWFPVDGDEWEENFEAKDVTHWLGPLPEPEPPKLDTPKGV